MGEPVLVIHGVSNRDPAAFDAQVHDLSTSVGDRWDLIPVFWGDLGGNPVGVTDTIPDPDRASFRGIPSLEDETLVAALLGPGEPTESVVGIGPRRAAGDQSEIVAQAAVRSMEVDPDLTTRAVAATDDVRQAIVEQWPQTRWLSLIQDEALLTALGQVVGDAVAHDGTSSDAAEPAMRALVDVGGFVKGVLHHLDGAVGAVIGHVAGNFNQYLRAHLVPTLVGFAGDVFVYEHQFPKIQERLREVMDKHAPDYGTQDRPIAVIAHSLGGVIAFDTAVSGEPRLWIRSLITFGSQSPFFHVVDPRGGGLAPYVPGQPVSLPATIGSWTNLWEPLDPLAFIAAKVFTLNSGHPPDDRAVHHLASSGLWTHTVYWHHPDLAAAIEDSLG
jgi:hypothetical protein